METSSEPEAEDDQYSGYSQVGAGFSALDDDDDDDDADQQSIFDQQQSS
jgi:hypothetical protein